MKKLALIILIFICSQTLQATVAVQSTPYISGHIYNITAIEDGFLIMVKNSSGVKMLPSNAPTSPYGWLKISDSSKALMTMALYCWSNNLVATVYCKGGINGGSTTGYGYISQIDPLE